MLNGITALYPASCYLPGMTGQPGQDKELAMPYTPETTLDPPSLRAWEDLHRDLKAARCSAWTTTGYAYSLSRAGAYLGGDLLGATRERLTEFFIDEGEGRRCGTVQKWWRDLRRFYNFCVAEGIVKSSPMARIPQPAGEQAAPPVLTTADLATLLKACAGRSHDALRDTAVILLWCETGSPRVAEVASLGTGDVELRGDRIRVAGKGGKHHWIALGPETARAMSRYDRARARHPRAACPAFFLGTKGPMTSSGLRQMLERRSAAAGLPRVRPHQLRHTATVRARLAGVPDVAIAHLNGWSSTRMMERYGRWAAATEALEHSRRAALTSGLVTR